MSSKEANPQKIQTKQWAIVGGVVLLLVLLFGFLSGKQEPTNVPPLPEETEELVSVSNQSAGTTVFVDSVSVPPPGVWVAVHEQNNGTLGSILGASRVRFQSTQVAIELLRPTLPTSHYAVVLYRDDGDNVFSLTTDSVYVDLESGTRVEVSFETNP